jgi:hypothetical protein
MTDKPVVGIDVSKGWLDACVAGARVERIANNAEAVGAWLDRVGPALVEAINAQRNSPLKPLERPPKRRACARAG